MKARVPGTHGSPALELEVTGLSPDQKSQFILSLLPSSC